ncbi:MAG: TRAP transporter large permease [Chloroflexota bacterium]
MSPEMIGFIGIIALVVLIFLRIWIGAVMVLIGFIGYGILAGWHSAFVVVGTEPYSNIAFYPITVIPLFILMGAVVANTGVSGDLYNTANKWVGKTRGGLAMATVVATAMFAAICGSSAATAATMGRVALPQMKRHNYDDKLATGCVAAGGTMGILIPPSMGFILYGILTETSIGKLFMAGIIPGILEAVFYMATIWIMCKWKPSLGPPGEGSTLKQKIFALKGTWAMLVLFILVMGGIYMGVFTPTEAGAIGAFGAILISFVSRKLTWHNLRGSVVETAQTTAMIVFMIVGAFILMRFLAISKLPFFIGELVAGLPVPPMMILVAIIIMYIILGCFLDVFAAIILTIPIIFPAVLSMGFDTIWFGVIMVRIMEIGLITPPFGLNVFIMSTVTDVPIGTIFRGVIPFVIADFVHVALLVAVPALSLFLPNTM